MATGIHSPLKGSPRGLGANYPYRGGMGMVPSAEFNVYFEDFNFAFIPTTAITNGPVANTPWGWQGAIIDTGATVALNTTAVLGAQGTLTLADATASEGSAFYGQKSLQLTAGKRFFMEARIQTDDVTDNNVQFGLSGLTATTNPEDLYNTTSADLIAFGILDGSALVKMLSDKSNSGSTAETGSRSLVVNTWHTLDIFYDGTRLYGFVDGKLAETWGQAAATIPTGVALAPFVSHVNGDGAGAAVVVIDYIHWSSKR